MTALAGGQIVHSLGGQSFVFQQGPNGQIVATPNQVGTVWMWLFFIVLALGRYLEAPEVKTKKSEISLSSLSVFLSLFFLID